MDHKNPEEKRAEERHKQVMGALEAIKAPLSAVALLALADEFYTKEERKSLYASYESLQETDESARQALFSTAATEEDGMGWDERERKYGRDVAKQQIAPKEDAMAIKKATGQRLTDFMEKHPLIVRLDRVKREVGKGPYD